MIQNDDEFRLRLGDLKKRVDYSDQELECLQILIGKIKAFCTDNFSDPTINEICSIWYQIISCVPINLVEVEVLRLVRARANVNGKFFNEECEISYNEKSKHLITPGRFNTYEEPVFYASVPVEEGKELYLLSCALEAHKDITDDSKTDPELDLTLGVWNVKQPFIVVNLCLNDIHLRNNKRLRGGQEQLLEGLEQVSRPAVFQFIKGFWVFISQISCKQHPTKLDYLVSTAFFHVARLYYNSIGKEIHGIYYPSAMTECEGLNIVLTKNAVDIYLSLESAIMYRFLRVDKKNEYNVFPCTELVKVIDGKFNFKILDNNLDNEVEGEG